MNFLDMLRNNPRGWGTGAGPEPEIAYQDDGGNLYGFDNALLRQAPAPHQGFTDQSLTDMLIGIGSAPAKMATGLASGLSPYGSEGFQVPPLAADAWDAINAPGTILNEGMTPQDRDRTATNAAGFMMGGGLVAPKPSLTSPVILSGERGAYGAFKGPREIGKASVHDLGQTAQIGEIFVDPAFRRQGIGRQLMDYAADDMGKPLEPSTMYSPEGLALAKSYFPEGALSNYRPSTIQDGWFDKVFEPETLFSNGSKSGAAVGNSLIESQQGKGFTRFSTEVPDGVRIERSPNGNNYNVYSGDDHIGAASVRDWLDNIQISNISINPEWQRKGIGNALHGIAEKDFGKPLQPDSMLSDKSYDFWLKHDPESVTGYVKQGTHWRR
jgi:ribosomal protein S18 acetylase RimI-like enzyme